MTHPLATWLAVGGGQLAIGHRPKRPALLALRAAGCTHVLTLLSAREGAAQLEQAARDAGLAWIGFPLDNGDPLPRARDTEARALLAELAALLAGGARVFVHCSAGIHRTGMIAYALLRHLGYGPDAARAALRALRAATADGVKEHRLAWGDRLTAASAAASAAAPASSPIAMAGTAH